jgi:Xaa-Pro aminopeptidase
MGHAIGLRLTEPPSIHPDDLTVLKPGMVITIEPAVTFSGESGSKRLNMVHEENLAITADGAELLSRRAPREMPIISDN